MYMYTCMTKPLLRPFLKGLDQQESLKWEGSTCNCNIFGTMYAVAYGYETCHLGLDISLGIQVAHTRSKPSSKRKVKERARHLPAKHFPPPHPIANQKTSMFVNFLLLSWYVDHAKSGCDTEIFDWGGASPNFGQINYSWAIITYMLRCRYW